MRKKWAKLVPLQVEKSVIVRPWSKAIKDPDSGSQSPPLFRCSYFMGLKKKPAPVFNSRLKAEGDELSTNLYISNLPKSLTEVVCSETEDK